MLQGWDAFKRMLTPSQSADHQNQEGGDDGWTVLLGCSVLPQYRCEERESTIFCSNIDECKRVCLDRDCGGFVFANSECTFFMLSREDLLGRAHCCMPTIVNSQGFTSVPKLFVAPGHNQSQQQWIQSMEADLLALRKVAEQHRLHRAEAERRGDVATAEQFQKELDLVKGKIARLAEALWLASSLESAGDCPASPRVLPGTPRGLSNIPQELTDQPSLSERRSHPSTSHCSNVDPRSSCQADLNASCQDVEVQRSKGSLEPQDGFTPFSGEVSGSSKSPSGKACGKGGKGKGGPMPAMKGTGPMPPKKGAGKGYRSKSPIGRNFHWKGLDADQVRGTVFDGDADLSAAPPDAKLNLEALQVFFQNEEASGCSPRSTASKPTSEVCVFSKARAQHIAIVLRRVFGSAPKIDNMKRLCEDLRVLKLPEEAIDGNRPLGAEELELLESVVPSAEESLVLKNAPAERLRRIEQLILPLTHVPRADARLRTLRLEAQAKALHDLPLSNIHHLSAASHALKESAALRHLLRVVAQLGSWINSADIQSQCGFALSSALGKLHQFRAFRGDRNLSLLHIVVLSAAGGNHEEVKALGRRLHDDLNAVPGAARVDLRELGLCVLACRRETDWMASELQIAEKTTDVYTEDARVQLKRIYEGVFLTLTTQLEKAWANTRQELEATLVFFAEPSQPEKGWEPCVQHFLQTVEGFRSGVQRAVQEILDQPDRFSKVYAAMPQNNVSEPPATDVTRDPACSNLSQDQKRTSRSAVNDTKAQKPASDCIFRAQLAPASASVISGMDITFHPVVNTLNATEPQKVGAGGPASRPNECIGESVNRSSNAFGAFQTPVKSMGSSNTSFADRVADMSRLSPEKSAQPYRVAPARAQPVSPTSRTRR